MATYRVVAIDRGNLRREVVVEAPSRAAAALAAGNAGVVISVEADRQLARLRSFLFRDINLRADLPPSELTRLTTEWAGLAVAGIPLHEVLRLSASGARRPSLRRRLETIHAAVRSGNSFSDALAADGSFPSFYMALIGAAEASGSLPSALQQLAAQLAQSSAFTAQMRTALLYPAFLTVTAGGAIIVLLTVVVPNLQALIDPRNANALPAITGFVIAASEFFRAWGIYLLAAPIALALVLLVGRRSPRLRDIGERFALRTPVLGAIRINLAAGRYCRTLATLTGSVSLARALPLAGKTVGSQIMSRQIEKAHRDVLRGGLLSRALATWTLLPEDLLSLIGMGERSGKLAEALGHAAALAESRTRQKLSSIATLAAPVLTLGFGLIAGVIVYAMLSTILSVNELAFQ